jgi:hypothetical protein
MVQRLALEFTLVAMVGLLLGVLGPFGTYSLPDGFRIAYWVVSGVIGYAIFRPLGVVGGWMGERLAMHPIIATGAALAIAALPMTLIIASVIWRFDLAAALRWGGLSSLYFQVWLLGFLVHGFFQFLFSRMPETAPVPAPSSPKDGQGTLTPEAQPLARLEDRLPPGFGPLLALKGEDHYVRAIGAAREELILIRLRDAIAELGDAPGLQVHRSWWVARDGVARVNRQNRAMTLTLTNGLEVPVARDQMARARPMFEHLPAS